MVKLPKNLNTELHIQLSTFKGKEYLDIREFNLEHESYTKKGISIPKDMGTQLLEGLKKLLGDLKEEPQLLFMVAKSEEDLVFNKKKAFSTLDEAMAVKASLGATLYKCKVVNTTITAQRALFKFNKTWKKI